MLRKKSHLNLCIIFFIYFPSIFIPLFLFAGIESNNILKHLEKMIMFGPRPSGSQALLLTKAYIIDELKKNRWEIKTASFIADTPKGIIPMHNIISSKKGKTAETIVLACHYESKYFDNLHFIGVNDSLSAVALLLELSRVIQPEPYYTLIFLFLDGEEAISVWSDSDGLYGSKYQISLWKKDKTLAKIKAFILLDLIGDKYPSFCKDSNSDSELINKVWALAKDSPVKNMFQDCLTTIQDDHIPFANENIRVLDIIHFPFPGYWHTENDSLENISVKNLGLIGEFILNLLNIL